MRAWRALRSSSRDRRERLVAVAGRVLADDLVDRARRRRRRLPGSPRRASGASGRRMSTICFEPATLAEIGPQVGLRVAVLLAGQLGLGDLLDELAGAAGDDPRLDDHRGQAGLQVGRVRGQALRDGAPGRRSCRRPRGPSRGGASPGTRGRRRRREVLLARVHPRVEVAEQLGDGLDALPGRARRRVRRLGRCEVAGLDGRDERRELGRELGRLLEDVRRRRLPVRGQRGRRRRPGSTGRRPHRRRSR